MPRTERVIDGVSAGPFRQVPKANRYPAFRKVLAAAFPTPGLEFLLNCPSDGVPETPVAGMFSHGRRWRETSGVVQFDNSNPRNMGGITGPHGSHLQIVVPRNPCFSFTHA